MMGSLLLTPYCLLKSAFAIFVGSSRRGRRHSFWERLGIAQKILFGIGSAFFGGKAEALPLSFENGAILRDSEIESILKTFLKPAVPFMRGASEPDIYVITGDNVNAFTCEYGIFCLTEFLVEAESPEEIIGVLFHEAGHVEGYHLNRHKEIQRNALWSAVIPALAGIAAALAGQDPSPALGGILLGETVGSSVMASELRSCEGAADQFCIRALSQLKWPARGIIAFMQRMQKRNPRDRSAIAYMNTHPFMSERLDTMHTFCKAHPEVDGKSRLPATFQEMFDRMRIKIIAFSSDRGSSMREIEASFVSEPLKNYGRAIAYFRLGDAPNALRALNAYTSHHGETPFTHELRAEILFQDRNIPRALKEIEAALAARPKDPLLLAIAGRIRLESHDKAHVQAIIRDLERVAFGRNPMLDPDIWYTLGVAQGRNGFRGRMHACLAMQALLLNEKEKVRQHLDLALRSLNKADLYYHLSLDAAEALKNMANTPRS